jgi:hypothetical protein
MIPAPFGRMMPCSWANEEATLCNNPECLAEAFACPTCGLDVRGHTSLMEAGCLIREAQNAIAMGEPGQTFDETFKLLLVRS